MLEQKLAGGNAECTTVANLKEARGKLWALFKREEREWIQKSRLKWSIEGDRNTKFFHLDASNRRRSNFTGSIQVGDDLVTSPGAIREAIGEHFKKMYNGSRAIPLKSFDCELGHISAVEAERLEREFSEKEIWEALSALDASKAPGPDGFNMGFLKKFWYSLKVDILNFFGSFFKGEIVDLSFNQSFVVLIPKKNNPVLIEDYRPISLVRCIYKLLSKVLAMRLREVMDGVIGEQQFAFCPGRQILDCSLIANEAALSLSPLLFNLVAEALSALLRKASSLGFFSGFSISQSAIGISHLQFADDLIIFCGAVILFIC
ncbi:hypothetical protein GQ457_13G017910 [Hibiscus cannabinus]